MGEAGNPRTGREAINELIVQNARSLFFVSANEVKKEGALHERKWFDYRVMTPLKATEVFYEQFKCTFRSKYRAVFDHVEAEKKTGVSESGLHGDRREFTSFWRARQFADSLGVPYDVFLDGAFEALIRTGWKRLPHVNQLYGTKNEDRITRSVDAAWAQAKQSGREYSRLPVFRNESFRGLAAQVAHREHVMQWLKQRFGKPFAVGQCCFLHRVLPPEQALAEFGEETLERAKREVVDEAPAAISPSAVHEVLPSCLGVPRARDLTSELCQSCKAITLCGWVEGKARDFVVSTYNSRGRSTAGDPVAERRRKMQRLRTARCRARKKAAREALEIRAPCRQLTSSPNPELRPGASSSSGDPEPAGPSAPGCVTHSIYIDTLY